MSTAELFRSHKLPFLSGGCAGGPQSANLISNFHLSHDYYVILSRIGNTRPSEVCTSFYEFVLFTADSQRL